jgi:hypothetical protein
MRNVLIQMLRQVRFAINIVPGEIVGNIFFEQVAIRR